MAKLKQSIKNLGLKLNGVTPRGKNITELLASIGSTYTGKVVQGNNITEVLNDFAAKCEAKLPTEE